jgi:hypothetical protein
VFLLFSHMTFKLSLTLLQSYEQLGLFQSMPGVNQPGLAADIQQLNVQIAEILQNVQQINERLARV